MTFRNFLSDLTPTDDGRIYIKKTQSACEVYISCEPTDYAMKKKYGDVHFCLSGDFTLSDIDILHGHKKIESVRLAELPSSASCSLVTLPCMFEYKVQKDGRVIFSNAKMKGFINDVEFTARRIDEDEIAAIDEEYWENYDNNFSSDCENTKEGSVRLSDFTSKYVLAEDCQFYFKKNVLGVNDIIDIYTFYMEIYEKDKMSPCGYDILAPKHVKVTFPVNVTEFRFILLGPDELYDKFDLGKIETHGGIGTVEYIGKFVTRAVRNNRIPFNDSTFEGFIEDCDINVQKIRKSEYYAIERMYRNSPKDSEQT